MSKKRRINNPVQPASSELEMSAPTERKRAKETSKSAQPTSAPLGDSTLEEELQALEQANSANAGNVTALQADDDQDAEPTLSERLKSLNVAQPVTSSKDVVSSRQQTSVAATSLTQTLIQALHSSDSKLLENCLGHSKPPLVNATLKRLPPHLVVPLVDALVERLGRSRKGYGAGSGAAASVQRGRALVVWLKATLVIHIAYLVSVPGLVQRLSALYRVIESRLELHEPLMELGGRLELVVSQIELRKEVEAQHRAGAGQNNKAVTSYVEGESSDESEDDAVAGDMEVDDEDIEDVVIQAQEEADFSDDQEEDSSDEDDAQPKEGIARFLDLEADASDDSEEEDFGMEEEEGVSEEGSNSDDDDEADDA